GRLEGEGADAQWRNLAGVGISKVGIRAAVTAAAKPIAEAARIGVTSAANRPRWSRSPRRLGIRSRQEMFAFATPIRQSATDRRVDAVQVLARLVGSLYLPSVAPPRERAARP